MNLKRLGSSMARRRGKRYPKIPDTLLDLTRSLLDNADVAKTVDEEENLYAGSVTASDGSHHLAFFSPRMLKYLGNLKLIQGDGTFKARPSVPASRQCFVIVTTWSNVVSISSLQSVIKFNNIFKKPLNPICCTVIVMRH